MFNYVLLILCVISVTLLFLLIYYFNQNRLLRRILEYSPVLLAREDIYHDSIIHGLNRVRQTEILNMYAAAYAKEVKLNPEDVVLERIYVPDMRSTRYCFRRRKENEYHV